MKHLPGLGLPLSALAAGVALCCVLPMTFMLVGLGGSWLAVFGTIAGYSMPVLTLSAILIAIGWGIAVQRGSFGRQKWLLGSATVLTGLAWIVFLNEATINNKIIEMM